MRVAFLFAGIALASPVGAQDDPMRTFQGPARFCGYTFAADLDASDHIELQRGPDFVLEALVSPRGGFGIYEGMAPQEGTGDIKVDAGLGKPTYRVGNSPDGYGYVIWIGTRKHPFYVHVWGMAFKGTSADFPLLRRLQFGDAAKSGCPGPTFEQDQ